MADRLWLSTLDHGEHRIDEYSDLVRVEAGRRCMLS
jgi:hypothetical protein